MIQDEKKFNYKFDFEYVNHHHQVDLLKDQVSNKIFLSLTINYK